MLSLGLDRLTRHTSGLGRCFDQGECLLHGCAPALTEFVDHIGRNRRGNKSAERDRYGHACHSCSGELGKSNTMADRLLAELGPIRWKENVLVHMYLLFLGVPT